MKTIYRLASKAILTFCLFFLINITSAQTSKTLDLGEFTTISLNSDYKVTIRQSNTQEVKATADPEIWSATNVWVDNGTLHIDVKGGEGSKKNLLKKLEDKITGTMELSITMKNLRKIVLIKVVNINAIEEETTPEYCY